MSLITRSARLALTAGVGTLLVAGAVAPAMATEGKPMTVTVPSSAVKDDSSKLCMPRETIDRSKKSTLPKTMCLTQAEWAERGVTIKIKK